MPFERSVGAVVFRREKKKILYLLLQHPKPDKKTGGHWAFPKGHVEKGENWEQTLRREVKEETGISKVKIIPGFSTWQRYFYRAYGQEKINRRRKREGINIFKTVTFYLGETRAKKVKLSHEHVNYKWLEYKKALERTTYQSSKNILKKAHKYLIKYLNLKK